MLHSKIENASKVGGVRSWMLLTAFNGLVASSYAIWKGYQENLVLLIIGLGLITAYLVLLARKPGYFSLLIDEKKKELHVRFFSIYPLSGRKMTIILPLKDFAGFHLTRQAGGLRRSLVLSVKTAKGVAAYKPISISLLTKETRMQLGGLLHALLPKNQSAVEKH